MKSNKIIIIFLSILIIHFFSCEQGECNKSCELKNSNVLVNPFGGWLKIVKKNGGQNGYSFIRIYQNSHYTTINCENSGYSKFPEIKRYTNIAFYPIKNFQHAVFYVNKQIASGKINGREYLKSCKVNVRWKSSSNDTITANQEILVW